MAKIVIDLIVEQRVTHFSDLINKIDDYEGINYLVNSN